MVCMCAPTQPTVSSKCSVWCRVHTYAKGWAGSWAKCCRSSTVCNSHLGDSTPPPVAARHPPAAAVAILDQRLVQQLGLPPCAATHAPGAPFRWAACGTAPRSLTAHVPPQAEEESAPHRQGSGAPPPAAGVAVRKQGSAVMHRSRWVGGWEGGLTAHALLTSVCSRKAAKHGAHA